MNVPMSAALTGLLVLAEQGSGELILRHDIDTLYNRTEYESACGSTVFRVRFRNGADEHGRVDNVLIDGRPVPGAVETLEIRAARRVISTIGIMNCGIDPKRPVLLGVMNLAEMESRAAGMRSSLFFRLRQAEDGGWRMTID